MTERPNSLVRLVARAPLPATIRGWLKSVYRLWSARRLDSGEMHTGPDVRAALATGDRDLIDASLRDFCRYRADVESALAPSSRPHPDLPIDLTTGPQSTQFMIDLLPHLQRHLATKPRGQTFDVLDVGPGNGHGTALLASLYASTRLGYRLRVTATDIVDHYHDYITVRAPFVTHIVEDVFEMSRSFDIVIASHVIEHLVDPVPFVQRLQQLARDCVFIVAPFREPHERMTKGHRVVVDHDLLERLDPVDVTVVNSVAWGAFMDPPYEMVIAKLPGRAV